MARLEKRVTFDMQAVEVEANRLRKLGYPDSLIELYEDNGKMRCRPVGSKPTFADQIRAIFPVKEQQ